MEVNFGRAVGADDINLAALYPCRSAKVPFVRWLASQLQQRGYAAASKHHLRGRRLAAEGISRTPKEH
jgi:hypothetical protein